MNIKNGCLAVLLALVFIIVGFATVADESVAVESNNISYNYNLDYEDVQGNYVSNKGSLPSVDRVYVANKDKVHIEEWSRTSDDTKHHVVIRINDVETNKLRIGIESSGFQDVVSWTIDSSGNYWTGSVWDALHILSDGGTVIVSGEVYSSPSIAHSSSKSLEARGGFTILGTGDAFIDFGNLDQAHIDAYSKGSVYPASKLGSLEFSIKSVSLNAGLWINLFSENKEAKDPGNVGAVSLTLDNVDITAPRGVTFYSQTGNADELQTTIIIKDSKIKGEGSVNNGLYSCFADKVEIINTTFDSCTKGVIITHKAADPLSISLDNVDFIDCGFKDSESDDASHGSLVVASRGSGQTSLRAVNCTFDYPNKQSVNGDVLLGSFNNNESKDFDVYIETEKDLDLRIWKMKEQEIVSLPANGSYEINGVGFDDSAVKVTKQEPEVTHPWFDDDEEEYIPPIIVPDVGTAEKESEDTTTVVACATAAVVAALMAVFLIVDRKR